MQKEITPISPGKMKYHKIIFFHHTFP